MSNSPNKIYIESDGYARILKRLRQISKVLDNAITITGTQVGIGLDPILGLIFSLYIIIESARLGIWRGTLGGMVVNIIIDALVGAVTMLGNLFYFAWRVNNYNITLLGNYLKSCGEK
jgi:hypothetical protein